jgi:predicted esterase
VEQYIVSSIRRYFDVEMPEARPDGKRWPLLVAMHGYQGDKSSMMRLARRIAGGKMVVISLQGPHQHFLRDGDDPKAHRVGFGWGTSWKMEESVALHHRDLAALIELGVMNYHADHSRVFLLAFSQPCSYNYRFVFSHPGKIRGVVAVCGGVPGDWKESPIYKRSPTHVLHIAVTNDEWFTREKNLEFQRQLPERAATLDFRFYKSTHKFPRRSIPHIRNWIAKHL